MPAMDDYLRRIDRFVRPQNHGYAWLLMLGGLAGFIAWGASTDPTTPSIVQWISGLILVWCFGGVVVRSIERLRKH